MLVIAANVAAPVGSPSVRAAMKAVEPSAFHALRCAMLASRLRADSMNGLSTTRAGPSPSFT
jgi:hypothetical protein